MRILMMIALLVISSVSFAQKDDDKKDIDGQVFSYNKGIWGHAALESSYSVTDDYTAVYKSAKWQKWYNEGSPTLKKLLDLGPNVVFKFKGSDGQFHTFGSFKNKKLVKKAIVGGSAAIATGLGGATVAGGGAAGGGGAAAAGGTILGVSATTAAIVGGAVVAGAVVVENNNSGSEGEGERGDATAAQLLAQAIRNNDGDQTNNITDARDIDAAEAQAIVAAAPAWAITAAVTAVAKLKGITADGAAAVAAAAAVINPTIDAAAAATAASNGTGKSVTAATVSSNVQRARRANSAQASRALGGSTIAGSSSGGGGGDSYNG